MGQFHDYSLQQHQPGFWCLGAHLANYRQRDDQTIKPRRVVSCACITLLGTILLIVGFAYYAMAKGRNPAWCLMAFLSLIGLIVLACLPDLARDGETYTGRRRRRRPDDYDDDVDDDRPRRRRRRDVDDDDYDDDEPPRARRGTSRRSRDDDDLDEIPLPPPLPARMKTSDEDVVQAEAIMPVVPEKKIVSCTKCRKSLTFPSSLTGKKVKCPACGDVFVA